MQDHCKSFGSLRDMVQAADHIARFTQSSRKEGDSYWSGTATFGEAKDLALRGWEEGVARVRPLAEAIFAHVADKVFVRQPDWTYAGGAVNVGRFVAGHPMAFNTWTNEPRTADGSKIIRIVYNTGASARVDAATMFNRGAAAIALVDALGRSGRRVQVDVVSRVRNSDGTRTMTIWGRLKEAGDPLNLNVLAFALCNAAMHRRIMFGIRETFPFAARQGIVPGNYGSSMDVATDAAIYFGIGSQPEWASEDGARVWVLAELARLGALKCAS
jgi:hypothetical protein